MNKRIKTAGKRTAAAFLLAALLLLFPCPLQAAVRPESCRETAGELPFPRPVQAAASAAAPAFDLPKIDLPKIDPSKIDKEAEKEKLREALRELDEKGLSPEKIAQWIWEVLSSRENHEKIGEAVKNVREKAEQITGKENAVKEESSADATGPAEEEIDGISQKVREEAAEEIGKAADQAADAVAEKAKEAVSEEIDQAAEDLKDRLQP